MSSRFVDQVVDDILQRASERHRGLQRQLGRWGAGRQAEVSIPNANHLPVLIAPAGSDPQAPGAQPGANTRGTANLALQAADGGFYILEGYSAPIGSARARAGGNGQDIPGGAARSGDTDLALLTLGMGISQSMATLQATVPIAAATAGVGLGSALLGFIFPISAAGISAAVGMATEGEFVEVLAPGVGVARGSGALTLIVALASGGLAASRGTGTLFVGNDLAGAGRSVAFSSHATLAGRVSIASAAIAASVGSATLIGDGIVMIGAAAKGVSKGAAAFGEGGPMLGGGPAG